MRAGTPSRRGLDADADRAADLCYFVTKVAPAAARRPFRGNEYRVLSMVKRLFSWRWATLASLGAAEAAILVVAMLGLTAPASAQWFDGGFNNFWGNPWGQQRRYRPRSNYYQSPYYERRQSQPDVDHSKAPAPKKAEQAPQMNVLVFGDSMADWLAYGLEQGFAESPEMGVTRKNRTNSGLIRQETRSDPRGEHPDWPKLVQETLAAEKPDFVVMMLGVNDRRPIREQRAPPRPAAAKPGQPQDPAATDGKTDPKKPAGETPAPAAAAPAETPAPAETEAAAGRTALHEFRTEKWAELYIKRIDETIAAMKSKGVPVFWVGLPPVRGTRSTADFGFLNDLFRSRADKAGIVFVDVTDGFVDESGHYSLYGPDVEGQNRRLRTQDGVYFTQAGARKLAHFVERELQRWMTSRSTPVALPVEEPATKAPEPQKPGDGPAGKARPLAGPVISLSAMRNSEDNDTLIGGGKARQEPAVVDAVASKVLLKGDPVPAPAGRSDDFSWPRRDIAPVGADPLVALATLPMTPMQTEQRAAPAPEAPAAAAAPGAAKPGPGGPGAAGPRVATRQSQQRQTGGWFGNWGGGWQQPQYQNSYRQQRAQPGFFPFLYRR